MADFTGLECDVCRSREDGVQRLPIGGMEVDLCPSCWGKHNLDALLDHARVVPAKAGAAAGRSRERSDESRRIKVWCEENSVELSRGPVPTEVKDAWKANDPSQVAHRYLGEGEPPKVGTMPRHAQPPGWDDR